MSSENTSMPLNPADMRPGETYITTTTTETTYVTEKEDVGVDTEVHREIQETMPLQSSGDYPTNPTTDHRYGANIGTGVYDPNANNVAHTTYTIREADFDRTDPDSGEGIHAHQYHGRDLGSIPIGTITIIHDSSGVSREIDPEVHARILDSEKHMGEAGHHVQRQFLRRKEHERGELSLEERERHERELEERRGLAALQRERDLQANRDLQSDRNLQHERDLQREREMAIATERRRLERERIDTHTGSIHGVFGHGRYRDAVIVGRDSDATDFGNKTAGKLDAHRDVLWTSGSEHDRLIGTIAGRERLAREQDAKFSSLLGSQPVASGAPGYSAGSTTTGAVPAAYATEPGVAQTGPRHAAHDIYPEVREDTGAGLGAAYDMPEETGSQAHEGHEPGSASHEGRLGQGKPSLMGKIFGKSEAAMGKTAHNPSMTAKGEERVTYGLLKN